MCPTVGTTQLPFPIPHTHSFTPTISLETMETIFSAFYLYLCQTPQGARPCVFLTQLWKLPYWCHLPALPSSQTHDQSSANFPESSKFPSPACSNLDLDLKWGQSLLCTLLRGSCYLPDSSHWVWRLVCVLFSPHGCLPDQSLLFPP